MVNKTKAEYLGYKVGDKFKVLGNESFHGFVVGSEVELIKDDGENMLMFSGNSLLYNSSSNSSNNCWWILLEEVKKISI